MVPAWLTHVSQEQNLYLLQYENTNKLIVAKYGFGTSAGGNPKQKPLAYPVEEATVSSPRGFLSTPQPPSQRCDPEDNVLRTGGKSCILLSFSSQELPLGKPVTAAELLSHIYCGLRKCKAPGFLLEREIYSRVSDHAGSNSKQKSISTFNSSPSPHPILLFSHLLVMLRCHWFLF